MTWNLALILLINCLIGLSGCVSPVIKITKPMPDIIKEYKSVVVWGGKVEMTDTGVEVKKGDYVTILAEGEISIRPKNQPTLYSLKPSGNLYFRIGDDIQRYYLSQFSTIYSDGKLYLGYGNRFNPDNYRHHEGHYVVDIIVWKTNDPILIANFFEEASQRDPQNIALKQITPLFEFSKELLLKEQKAKNELAAAEKAITDIKLEELSESEDQLEELSEPEELKPEIADSGSIVIAEKNKESQSDQGADQGKQIQIISPKPQEEKKPSASFREKEIITSKDDEKEKKIAELNERLQKALQALREVEEMKKQMSSQLAEQQKKEIEIAARLEALEKDKTKQAQSVPVIAIATPKDGITVESDFIAFAGVVEHDKGIGKFEILLNGKPAYLKDQRGINLISKDLKRIEFTERLQLKEGKNIITVVAQEKEGIKAEKTVTINMNKKRGEIWAVIIGINKYNNLPALKYAVNDAKAVYRYMTEINQVPQDHIWLLLDEEATMDRIRSTLGTQLRRKAGKEDMVIIYLAGHGATEKDVSSPDGDGLEKYILPHNADPADLYASAIPMGEISRIFQRISSEKLIFLTDTCYSGASGGRTILTTGTRTNVSSAFMDRLSQGRGRMIIAASDANQVSAEKDELKHGVFTYYLLEGLGGKADYDGDRIITLDEIYRYVSIKVPQATGQDQHPVKKGEMIGDIILGIVK